MIKPTGKLVPWDGTTAKVIQQMKNLARTDMLFIGVDPGVNGGLAFIWNPLEYMVVPMPTTMKDVWDEISKWGPDTGDVSPVAVIEQVGGFVGKGSGEKGGGAANGSAMFKFGYGAGALEMALVAARIPYEKVVPRTWQKGLSISPKAKSESKGDFKNRLKAKCQALFPSAKVTLKTCDALLICEYCRRKHLGLLGR